MGGDEGPANGNMEEQGLHHGEEMPCALYLTSRERECGEGPAISEWCRQSVSSPTHHDLGSGCALVGGPNSCGERPPSPLCEDVHSIYYCDDVCYAKGLRPPQEEPPLASDSVLLPLGARVPE